MFYNRGSSKEGGGQMTRFQEWISPEGLILLEGWTREGKSEEEMAGYMGISTATLKSWKKREPKIQEALQVNGQALDFQVESALLKKALGYQSTERKVEISPKGERKEVETVKQVGPDMSAISLWLKKRRPERWGDGAGNAPKPENNLMEMLEQEGALGDAIPELQSAAEADPELVETE
jgi:hypothetical protein